MARRRFVPTEEQRNQVAGMAAYGIPHPEIAQIVGVGETILRRKFREELDLGLARANAKVAETLFQMATSGKNIAATIFWMKTRAGWREIDLPERVHGFQSRYDIDNMSEEEIKAEIARLRAQEEAAAGREAPRPRPWPNQQPPEARCIGAAQR